MKYAVAVALLVGLVAGGCGEGRADGKKPPKAAPAAKVAPGAFKAGDKVDAMWTDDLYYDATVAKVNSNGTYSVDFADGSQLERAKPIKLRAPTPFTPKVGDHVEAFWSSGGYYRATVTKAKDDGTFDVTFDEDGAAGSGLAPAKLRAYVEPVLKAGDPVWGRWTDSSWYAAKVTAVSKDGTVKITYASDGSADALPRNKIRGRDPATTPKEESSGSSAAPADGGNCPGADHPRRCGGVCVKLGIDNNNCGSCGNKCKAGYHCESLFCRDAEGHL